MSDTKPLLYRLNQGRIDESLHDWLRVQDPAATTWDDALASRHGFTLATLLENYGGVAVSNPRFGRTSALLWNFVYWLFVPAYAQHVQRPIGFHPKSVLVAEVIEESSIDGGGAAYLTIAVTSAPPVLVEAPRMPGDLGIGAPPHGFAESRELLYEYATACVERVNLVVPAARTLGIADEH